MTWEEAKEKIKKHVKKGTNLNTKRCKKSKYYRYVRIVPPPHFRVQIGVKDYVNVTWDMLETCWNELNRTGKWDRKAYEKVFEKFFPEKMSRPCHNHVVGKIFEKAGLVYSVDDKFYVLK